MIDLSRLAVGALLGKGGQGEVFLASDPSGARLAVKVMLGTPALDRAQVEARVRAFTVDPFSGPPVAPLLAFGELASAPEAFRRQLRAAPRGALYLVAPFVDGVTLAALGDEWTALEVVAALEGVARLLLRLPSGVAHGDLKAANVFARPKGELTLVDPDLFRAPAATDDLHGLGALGRELLRRMRFSEHPTERTAATRLSALCEGLTSADPMSLPEALRQLGELGVWLSDSPATALDARIEKALATRPSLPTPEAVRAASAPRVSRALLAWQIGALVATGLAIGGWEWLRPRPSAPSEPVAAAIRGTEGEASRTIHHDWKDGAFRTFDPVPYSENVHLLGPKERVGADYVLGKLFIEDPGVDAVEIVNREGSERRIEWRTERPPRAAQFFLALKPGYYEVLTHIAGVADPKRYPFHATLEHALSYGVNTNDWVGSPGPRDAPEDTAPEVRPDEAQALPWASGNPR